MVQKLLQNQVALLCVSFPYLGKEMKASSSKGDSGDWGVLDKETAISDTMGAPHLRDQD